MSEIAVKDTVKFVEGPFSKKVLDKGQVRLLNHMGDDLAVVAAARVSNGESYEEASHGPEADEKLIRYLVKHRHGTPFEHSVFQFYVKTPLFVRSEWHRHRMASYNEISGRYVKYEPEFYIPDKFRIQGDTNKQGSKFPETMDDVPYLGKIAYSVDKWSESLGEFVKKQSLEAYANYNTLISMGIAKEMARMVLPPNLYTQFYVTINARSLMNFLSLRCAEDAQWEIQQYALAMRDMFKEIMPFTYSAWEQNGFIAP